MLGTRCAAASGVLVRNRRRTGTTIVLLPLFLLFRFTLPADAPSESPGEWKAGTGAAWATAETGVAQGRVEVPAISGVLCCALRSASWRAWSSSCKRHSRLFASFCFKDWMT